MGQTVPRYQEFAYRHPFNGWHSQLPENVIEPSFSPQHSNFMIRNGELKTGARFLPIIPGPKNDFHVRGLTSFVDSNGVVHTVCVTSNNLHQLIFNGKDWFWNQVGAFNTNGLNQQHAMQTFLSKIYWTTGTPGLWYWDGISGNISEATNGAGSPYYGAYYLGELGFHLILLNTVENDVSGNVGNYPQRIRWSPSGLPTVWSPVANSAAGFSDQLDVPDAITGFLTIGQAGFIFRVNGISHMTLTGLAVRPFNFDHLWASDRGIGSAYASSIASYGPLGIFISTEEIYKITASSFDPIGGGARDKILNDLADATQAPVATIIPGYHRRFVFLTYQLMIPVDNTCINWTYNLENQSWTRRIIDQGYATAKMRLTAVK